MTRKPLIAVTVLAVGWAVAACGDDYDSTSESSGGSSGYAAAGSGTDAASKVAIDVDPDAELAFTRSDVTADAGTATIELDNETSIPHNVAIEDEAGGEVAATETVTGESTTAQAELEPGTYTFYCAVPGHREAGMEGTLTVR